MDEFLRPLTREIDPAFRVALTLAMLAGGQAAAEAGTRLLRESETRMHSVPADCFLPPTSNRAMQDAERRLQMFLEGFGYVDAFVLRREVMGRERLFAPASVHLHEGGAALLSHCRSGGGYGDGSGHPDDYGRTGRGGEQLLVLAALKEPGAHETPSRLK